MVVEVFPEPLELFFPVFGRQELSLPIVDAEFRRGQQVQSALLGLLLKLVFLLVFLLLLLVVFLVLLLRLLRLFLSFLFAFLLLLRLRLLQY